MTDWIAALGDIPQQAIEQAVTERMRADNRARPTPGEIRHRALARVEQPCSSEPRPFEPVVVSEEELQRRREMQGKIRAEFPMLKRITTSEGD